MKVQTKSYCLTPHKLLCMNGGIIHSIHDSNIDKTLVTLAFCQQRGRGLASGFRPLFRGGRECDEELMVPSLC